MSKKKKKQSDRLKLLILITAFITICIVSFLRYGIIGSSFDNIFRYIFGDIFYFILSVLILSYFSFNTIKKDKKILFIVGVILFLISAILIQSFSFGKQFEKFELIKQYFSFDIFKLFSLEKNLFYGGVIGVFIYSLFNYMFDFSGTLLITIIIFVISLVFIIPFQEIYELFKKKENKKIIKEYHQQKEEIRPIKKTFNIKADTRKEIEEPVKKPISKSSEVVTNEKIKSIRYVKNSDYILPDLKLLDPLNKNTGHSINKSSAEIKGERIIEILNSFDIACELVKIHIGPSVTKFEIRPEQGVKISKILSLSNDIKMELAAKSIRIEAPIPGLSAVGIEIPNLESTAVQMIEILKQIPDKKKDSPLLVALGKDLMGNVIFSELDKMPHLLVAGATGAGKSVCMNAIISSILLRTNPEQVKLMLIDPKKVEFLPYKDVPHLFWPVIDDSTMANNALKRVVAIMEERYALLSEVGAKNIEVYNEKVMKFNQNATDEEKMQHLPYMVVIIDELADLMMVAGKEVENSIQLITQKARAAGIHLVIATQRPSTDVITGVIKANIPSRIAFAVASQIDSRTILDSKGAEELLGRGDMLYIPMGTNVLTRVQGVYITDDEIARITEYCKSIAKPNYEDSYYQLAESSTGEASNVGTLFEDPLFEEVKKYVIETQKCSASLIQRRFSLGYNRAARLVENLEELKIVGPAQGSKPREVYYKHNDE